MKPNLNPYQRLLSFILIAVVILSCSDKPANQSPPEQGTGRDIEKVKFRDLNDKSIDLSQYNGKVVFINFWATWCRPCIEEMPSIEKTWGILKDKNIEFVFASNEELGRIQNFITKKNLKQSFVQVENMEDLKIQVLPTTFIFNTQGKLVFSETGFRKWDEPTNIEMITKIINNHE